MVLVAFLMVIGLRGMNVKGQGVSAGIVVGREWIGMVLCVC